MIVCRLTVVTMSCGVLAFACAALAQAPADRGTKANPAQAAPVSNEEPHPGLQRTAPSRVAIYKTIGGVELKLHVFEPDRNGAAGPVPALVFFHGGAWRKGGPDQFYSHAAYLARRGMWVASAEYRLLAQHAERVADCIEDAQDAIRFVRGHAAELGVDRARIAAGGGSAGGHLAVAAALLPAQQEDGEDVSSRPNLLVLYNPALFHPRAEQTLHIEQFSRETPPSIQFYGPKDRMLEDGKRAVLHLQKRGCTAELFIADDPQVGHGFFNDEPWLQRTLWQSDRFLAAHGYLDGNPTLELPEGPHLMPFQPSNALK